MYVKSNRNQTIAKKETHYQASEAVRSNSNNSSAPADTFERSGDLRPDKRNEEQLPNNKGLNGQDSRLSSPGKERDLLPAADENSDSRFMPENTLSKLTDRGESLLAELGVSKDTTLWGFGSTEGKNPFQQPSGADFLSGADPISQLTATMERNQNARGDRQSHQSADGGGSSVETGVKTVGYVAAAGKVAADMGALPVAAIYGGGGAGAAAVATATGGVTAAFLAGWGVGTLINQGINAATGSDLGTIIYDALNPEDNNTNDAPAQSTPPANDNNTSSSSGGNTPASTDSSGSNSGSSDSSNDGTSTSGGATERPETTAGDDDDAGYNPDGADGVATSSAADRKKRREEAEAAREANRARQAAMLSQAMKPDGNLIRPMNPSAGKTGLISDQDGQPLPSDPIDDMTGGAAGGTRPRGGGTTNNDRDGDGHPDA